METISQSKEWIKCGVNHCVRGIVDLPGAGYNPKWSLISGHLRVLSGMSYELTIVGKRSRAYKFNNKYPNVTYMWLRDCITFL